MEKCVGTLLLPESTGMRRISRVLAGGGRGGMPPQRSFSEGAPKGKGRQKGFFLNALILRIALRSALNCAPGPIVLK